MKFSTRRASNAVIYSLIALAVLIFIATSRGETIDQYNLVPRGSTSILASIIDDHFDHAQTFTAQLSGQLARIELGVYRYSLTTADLWFELRRAGLDGIPELSNDSLLYSETINSKRIPTMDEIDFLTPFNSLAVDVLTSNIQIHAGDKLAIVLRSPMAIGGYNWWLNVNQDIDQYPNGNSYYRYDNSIWSESDHVPYFYDNHFTEYLVPEPSAAVLIILVVARSCYCRCQKRR